MNKIIVLLCILLFVCTGSFLCEELKWTQSGTNSQYWHNMDWKDVIYISTDSI